MKYSVQRTLENYQELNDWANNWAEKHKTHQVFTKKNDCLFYNLERNSLEGGEIDNYNEYQLLSFEEFKSRFMTEKKYTVDYCKNNPVGILVHNNRELEILKEMNCVGAYNNVIDFPYYTIPYNKMLATDNNWDGKGWSNKEHKKIHYELIDFKTFIEYNKEKMEESKEIRGYKLKEEYKHLKEAAATIIRYDCPNDVINVWNQNLTNVGVIFNYNSALAKKLEKAGVLNIWFEPVYKESEKTLTLSNGKTVVVGKDKIIAEGKTLIKSDLSWLLTAKFTAKVGEWAVEIKDITYKIGCWENVKLEDIKLIISEYEKLNP